MKDINLFRSINICIRVRSLLFLFLVLYMTTIPVIEVVFHMFDAHYELCEIYEDNEFKEKEMIVDDEEDEGHNFNSVQNLSSSHNHKYLTDFNPDVPLPPPKEV